MEGQRKPTAARSFVRQQGKTPAQRAEEFTAIQRRLKDEARKRRIAAKRRERAKAAREAGRGDS